jgi:hypothetical protein
VHVYTEAARVLRFRNLYFLCFRSQKRAVLVYTEAARVLHFRNVATAHN